MVARVRYVFALNRSLALLRTVEREAGRPLVCPERVEALRAQVEYMPEASALVDAWALDRRDENYRPHQGQHQPGAQQLIV